MNKFITLMAVLRRKAYLPAVALLALMSGLAAKADVVINATNFPDENFRNFILNELYTPYGYIGADGKLTDTEIADVKVIECNNEQIASLKGIEHFTALQELYCHRNKLNTIDVRKNTALRHLELSVNNIGFIDLSKNTALIYLDLGNNNLTSIDVSNNTALQYLSCPCNQLTSLDVSNNTALQVLSCGKNQLTSLDVSNNTALQFLSFYQNQLTSIDVSNNPALESLDCSDNQLTTLDLSNCTALTWLCTPNNQLTELDLSTNPISSNPNYTNQTRTLTAESAVTPEGERFYYLRLDDNLDGDKSIVERMTETNAGGVASQFDPSRVLEWTAGGTIVNGQKRVILNADDMNPQTVKGKILLLTDISENYTTKTASGTVKYKYNVNNPRDPNGVSGDFTLNWTAPMPEGSTSGPAALELNEKAIRLQLTQSHQLEMVTPNAGEITWTSSNPEAVEVDSTGRITALKNGTAIITATTSKGVAWCAVWSNLLGDLNEDDKVDISDLNTEVSIVLGN